MRNLRDSMKKTTLRLMERFVEYYNGVRLHSAIGYIDAVNAGLHGWQGHPRSGRSETANSSRLGSCGVSAVRTRCPHEHSDPQEPHSVPSRPQVSLSTRERRGRQGAKPARAARFTLDAPEHSGTIPGAIGDILPPGVALTYNLAVIFTLNQYSVRGWLGEMRWREDLARLLEA